jgi:hypothetical protein
MKKTLTEEEQVHADAVMDRVLAAVARAYEDEPKAPANMLALVDGLSRLVVRAIRAADGDMVDELLGHALHTIAEGCGYRADFMTIKVQPMIGGE